MSSADAIAVLTKASKGLLYESESDEPFTPFTWKKTEGALTREQLLKQAHQPANSPVQEIALQDFFKDLTTEQDWHGDEEKAKVKQYRNLLAVISRSLAGVKVFKVGETKVSIFIVGQTDDGNWAGLKTTVVET
jgi:Nuclease A inhibitor-like protein